MEIYVNFFLISVCFSYFLIFNHDFIVYIDFTQQQVMTSQIRSHIEYFNTDLYFCAHCILYNV